MTVKTESKRKPAVRKKSESRTVKESVQKVEAEPEMNFMDLEPVTSSEDSQNTGSNQVDLSDESISKGFADLAAEAGMDFNGVQGVVIDPVVSENAATVGGGEIAPEDKQAAIDFAKGMIAAGLTLFFSVLDLNVGQSAISKASDAYAVLIVKRFGSFSAFWAKHKEECTAIFCTLVLGKATRDAVKEKAKTKALKETSRATPESSEEAG